MRKTAKPKLPRDLEAEASTLAALGDTGIDLCDIPEVTNWSTAERGKLRRPA